MTIVSPGNLNTRFSKEDLFRGVSSLRNKHLADLMYRMERMEAYGTGIPRMFMEYKDEDSGPEIDVGPSTFTLVLPTRAASAEEGSDLEAFLSSRSEFSRGDLQDHLSVSRSGATAVVNDLIAGGRIVRIGDGRTTRYRVLRPPHPFDIFAEIRDPPRFFRDDGSAVLSGRSNRDTSHPGRRTA